MNSGSRRLRARLCADEGHGALFVKRIQHNALSVLNTNPKRDAARTTKFIRFNSIIEVVISEILYYFKTYQAYLLI